jgi:nitroreductase
MPYPLTVAEALRKRRAVRAFDPSRPLPDDLLTEILTLATMAPSAFNLQPWRFVVVRSAANRERLQNAAYAQVKITQAPVVVIVLAALHPHVPHLDTIIDDQVARGVFSAESGQTVRGRVLASMQRRRDPALWAMRSAMLAAGQLMTAAEGLGAASAPMEGFDDEKVRAAFGIPDDHILCCLVALGYPAEEKPFPGRLPLDDVCYAEHFGQPWRG